ncbi:alpha/beta fold hydrolase [Streptomyces panaciradicis]|uniref:alpha/beta fold hydrolase n=1 Tax=Streptomyces panaciradicis TaxID=1470261 RepID=UPI00201CE0EB|nr:alpha/beta fold hydrolase [Streptomyces panaciradicis]MCL6674220.1 alpha/beta fold hydrolase [Streptomyces panaciradicis]
MPIRNRGTAAAAAMFLAGLTVLSAAPAHGAPGSAAIRQKPAAGEGTSPRSSRPQSGLSPGRPAGGSGPADASAGIAGMHTVTAGNTLWDIARQTLGNALRWDSVYDLNRQTIEHEALKHGYPSSDRGHWIFPGTLLTLPPLQAARTQPSHFVPAACPTTYGELKDTRCGFLVVPENRAHPSSRTLRLAVARVRSASPTPHADPIVFFTGGPGADALADIAGLTEAGLNRDRDLIVLSQRGTYSSERPLTCPEIDRFYGERVHLLYDAPSTGNLYAQAAARCHDRLAAQGIDLAAYNTSENAADAADLRTALGIGQWNVLSHSYGTQLALTYMRMFPQGVRSVTVDGVVPPSVATPGWTWSSMRESFDNIVSACAAQPSCRQHYPDIGATYLRMVRQLEAHPVTTQVTVPQVGRVKVVLDGGALLNWMVRASHAPETFAVGVDELAHGRPERIAQQWASAWLPGSQGMFAHGFSLSVWCSEWVPFETPQEQLAKGRQAFPELPRSVLAQAPQLPFLRQACQAWNVPKAPDSVREATSSSIPTLAISGSFDAQTGAQWGRYVARTLSRSTVVTLAGVAHGTYDNPCGAKVITSFFDDPEHPDTRCVNTVKPAPFATGSEGAGK